MSETVANNPQDIKHDLRLKIVRYVSLEGDLFATRTKSRMSAVVVRFWVLSLLTAILPARWLIRRLNQKPIPGRCRRCGYDLRATPQRCPECGMEPAK